MSHKAIAQTLGLLAGLYATGAAAQSSTPQTERIRGSAALIGQMIDLLKSNEPATRVAAFKDILASNDPALIDLAVETALASPDRTLQALGLRAGFRQVRSLVAKLDARQSGAAGQAVLQACGDAVQYTVEAFDYASGAFKVRGQDNLGVGQVNGATISFTIEYGCSLSATLQPDGSLAGIVSAPYKKGSLPAALAFR